MTLRQGNISLILEGYNDLFSDFDPRGYDERALSDDFLQECRRAVRDQKEGELLELRLLIPKHLRNPEKEAVITRRLKAHYTKHLHEQERVLRGVKRRGMRFFGVGAICLLISATLYDNADYALFAANTFLYNLLLVIFEPAGWFSFWTGLDQFFFEAKRKEPEYDFYKKMARLEISFHDY